jgi:hypothetical protein
MNKTALGLVLAAFAGTAAAGDLADRREYEAGSYAAHVYYRVDFGGDRGQAQSLGLRFDNERMSAAGAPSLLKASFGAQGMEQLKVSGFDLRGAMLAANQNEGGFLDKIGAMSTAQLVAMGVTTVLFVIVAADVTQDEDTGLPGTGGT